VGRTENVQNCLDPDFAKCFTVDYMFEQVQKVKISIRSEEVKEGGEMVMCTFTARKLENKDFLGKSDPYLEILKRTSDGGWQVVHRTEVVKNNLNPRWRPFQAGQVFLVHRIF
ncbi:CPNE3-like protein, partial [Mya arenaria]